MTKSLECLTATEKFILSFTGKVIIVVDMGGFFLTLFFDRIARGLPIQIGWLQGLGLLVFFLLAIFGFLVESYLNQIKKILDDYVK